MTRKCVHCKRVQTKFKRGGYNHMLVKFLDDEPGIAMHDRSAKVVLYTCNPKETISFAKDIERRLRYLSVCHYTPTSTNTTAC